MTPTSLIPFSTGLPAVAREGRALRSLDRQLAVQCAIDTARAQFANQHIGHVEGLTCQGLSAAAHIAYERQLCASAMPQDEHAFNFIAGAGYGGIAHTISGFARF